MNQNNEFLKICQQAKDKARFEQFLIFCIERIEQGQDTAAIWDAWNAGRRM